jgi:Uma2 family endonuclease
MGGIKTMIAPVTKKLFTVDEYYRIYEAGVLNEDDRVELINGEIVYMSPAGARHSACVNRLSYLLIAAFGREVMTIIQNPVNLDQSSQPQPDVVLAKWKDDYYASGHPTPEDILLLIEVSDSSVGIDQNYKIPLYAAAGIRETWLVNLPDQCIEVYHHPEAGSYTAMQTFKPGQSISLQAFPDIQIAVTEVLPAEDK